MSTKSFFKVLPELDVDKRLHMIFEPTEVTQVVYKKSKKTLAFKLISPQLILYKNQKKMQQQIKYKLFAKADVTIGMSISYNLPETYTVEQITDEYKPTILANLQEEKMLFFLILSNSEWKIKNNILTFVMPHNALAKTQFNDIRTYFKKLYKKKFDIEIDCDLQFNNDINTLQEENNLRLMQEIEFVVNTSSEIKEKKETTEKTDVPPTKETKSKKPQEQNLVYGKMIDGDIIPINEVLEEIGEVVIQGKIISLETREIRMEKTIVIFDITDFTDTITAKLFIENEKLGDVLANLKKGEFYKIKGNAIFDKFDKEISIGSIRGIKSIPDFTETRMDTALEKRVELHLHTVMSDMDSVVNIKEVINRAKSWGMPAIAITDHGCLQAFPIANHCIKKDDPFKIIYGVEAYFVDDFKNIVVNPNEQSLDAEFVVFDLETTGFSPKKDCIIEIGAVKIQNKKVVDKFSSFIDPERPIPYEIKRLTGITDKDVRGSGTINEVLPKFLDFCKDSVLVAHNAEFDMGFINQKASNLGIKLNKTSIDTVALARVLVPKLKSAKLNTIAKHFNISLENHHRAVDDAQATTEIFLNFVQMLSEKEINMVSQINTISEASPDYIKKLPTYHGIILVQNEVGRINLNKLVSASHLEYFNRRPRMPKSLIMKHREGLILGSACEAGEVFKAVMNDKDDDEIAKIVNFYDYLEIQPILNNEFMINNSKYKAENFADLQGYNERIVELGEIFQKPVVATCDVHFLDPQDEVYRRIIMAGKGFKDADNQPPLYFRTTDEMLKEFSYLGAEKALEVVVTNTQLIANKIEKISPVLPNKCPPEIPNSDVELREICYKKAHEIYGPTLHEVVVERLERELNSIISNGFAVMYIISQKIVWDSNDHGYLVGSRGSVGSSFAATMSGITEVNPLAPHYICPSCFFTDFESETVKSFAGSSGCDMPDANCPKCNTKMDKEGHDIPFETFLGFKGDKEPDIDLNFSGEYQSEAHKYVEVLFGEGKAFRAGTIGTMAEKTALSYVFKYFEERQIIKRRAEMRRLAQGCTGVKRTTGQHPGGIIVVPNDRDIFEFTAIQRPANDVMTSIITTHYEYHSIDHNLLKLDILGHDDPTMIRRLEDITGIKSDTIKLDDKDVMAIFHGTERLGISPEDIGGIKLGSLGIPEFGTDFVIQMLIDAKPQNFSDLVRISGLSHGTDVWIGNAQTLIEEGKGTISTVICTRDDIMTYLINQGVEKGLAFTIMESVRKGKGLLPDWEEEMLKCDVPDWYIWSCKKIKYMFPKAHAVAYVMMAWRIAWYKVFYPLAYYTAFFSIRASSFSYELMCFGKAELEEHLRNVRSKGKENQTAKEQDLIKDMRIAQEMYARGFEFMPIDLTLVHAKDFQIIDNKIMPALSSIDGLGEKVGEAIIEAVKDGEFLSKEEFRQRTKASNTLVEKMTELGILGNLPESNQLSLLDFKF